MTTDGYQRASACNSSACVEVRHAGETVQMRDSKTGRELTFTTAEWGAFVGGAQAGEFDL